MDYAERQQTTEYAIAKIREFLDRNDFTSAVLLSSIYVEMRLRTLVTLRLQPPEKNWYATSDAFTNLLGYNKLLNLCSKVGILPDCNQRKLKELSDERNHVAHDTELWKEIIDKERQESIIDLCNNAIEFLKNTTQ